MDDRSKNNSAKIFDTGGKRSYTPDFLVRNGDKKPDGQDKNNSSVADLKESENKAAEKADAEKAPAKKTTRKTTTRKAAAPAAEEVKAAPAAEEVKYTFKAFFKNTMAYARTSLAESLLGAFNGIRKWCS